MPKVHILPLDQVIEAPEGQTIMGAAQDRGFYWPTTCGGQGICTTCACTVETGAQHLDPMSRSERRTLAEERGEAALRSGTLRLACQARVHGDVTVRKAGVRLGA